MAVKYLLVGKERICKQVAYVMHYDTYTWMVDLPNDIEPDCQVVICDFKKKYRVYPGAVYLDDLCEQLDREFVLPQNTLTTSPLYPQSQTKSSWLVRLWRKIKNHQLGAAVVLKINNGKPLRNLKLINQLPVEKLKPSELFLKVLFAKPTNIICNRLEKVCIAGSDGFLWGCSKGSILLPFGYTQDLNTRNLYDNALARIIKLSSLNRSYCLCNLQYCKFANYGKTVNHDMKPLTSGKIPDELVVSIDASCNLQCEFCRCQHYQADQDTENNIAKMRQALEQAGWLNQTPYLWLACDGEVFYGKNYRQLLFNDLQRQQIHIYTNGTLFDAKNWELIKDRYQDITVSVSVDAATAATYQKVRGGNFDKLLVNLKMLGEQRRIGKIKHYVWNFLVQADNYLEMKDFIRLAKSCHVDKLWFQFLENWNIYNHKNYKQKSMQGKYPYQLNDTLTAWLNDPIFQDPLVDLTSLCFYHKK